MKTTTVGIIGAGAIGQAFAEQLVKADMNAILSNSRGPESLTAVVEKLGHGARAGTVEQAAQADIVFVSTNWDNRGRVTRHQLGGAYPDRRDQPGHTARLHAG